MINEIYIAIFGLVAIAYLFWGINTLPVEWQMAAAIPISKNANGLWSGLNFTYYGILIANAIVAAALVFSVLMGSINIPKSFSFTFLFFLFLATLPSARIMAKWIENKTGTFTVGGASFVGIVTAPAIIPLVDWYFSKSKLPTTGLLPIMAALSLSYCFGEGLGRMACISFGCCYGKPLAHMPVVFSKLFDRFNFTFSGKTKKIVYAHGWEGIRVLPIQAITSLVNIVAGLAGTFFFVYSSFKWALAISIGISFGWRVVSEFLRADYRGGGRLTAYQKMGALSLLCGLSFVYFFPQPMFIEVDLKSGVATLWCPEWILFLQGLWLGVFLYLGRSKVTGSEISFFVHSDRV